MASHARGSGATPPDWHAAFLAMLSRIERHAKFAFRHLKGDGRDDAVQEVVANALVAYERLVRQGRPEVATCGSLARYAVAQVRCGRRVGSRLRVRDVLSPHCRRSRRVRVQSLHAGPGPGCEWQEILVEDKTVTPADLAAARIDYPAWLESLPLRTRRIAEALAAREATAKVARRFRLSPARISQFRRELRAAWLRFVGDLGDDAAA